MTTRTFYQARADECGRDADAAALENVRDRARRSQVAWQEMADRIERIEAMRDARASDRAIPELAMIGERV